MVQIQIKGWEQFVGVGKGTTIWMRPIVGVKMGAVLVCWDGNCYRDRYHSKCKKEPVLRVRIETIIGHHGKVQMVTV